MYNDLHKSFDSNLSRFYDWERLAKSETNPNRQDDIISAAIIAGKLEIIACILSREWNDISRKTEAEAAAASVRLLL